MPGGGSIVVRRQLGKRLQRARLAAGKEVSHVVAAQLASAAKISRIERGQSSIRVADVVAFCQFYGVDQAATDAMVALAPGTRQDGAWWEEYGQAVVPEWFSLYTGLEAIASRVRTWDVDLVHGLLQTESYARAVITGADQVSSDIVERRLRFRIERQQRIFGGDWPAQIMFIMGEAALVSAVGTADVLREQIEHLRKMDRRKHIQVRVVPFTAGFYPRVGDFALLGFDDEEDPPVAYLDSPGGARYFDTPQDRARYERAHEIISDLSVPIKEWTP